MSPFLFGCQFMLVNLLIYSHHCFDAAYRAFHQYGSSVVKTAVCSVMYIGEMACAWESVSDLDGWGSNPFRALLRVFEYGHWPLGMDDEQLYLF